MRLIDHLKSLGLSNRDAREAMASGKVRFHGVPTADAGREVAPADVEIVPNAPRISVGRDPFVMYRDAPNTRCCDRPPTTAVPSHSPPSSDISRS